MFVAINRITVQKGQGESLEKRFAASEGLKGQPGVLGFELLRRSWERGEPSDNEEFLAVTRWETEEHFHAWTRSDAFKKAHSHGGNKHAHSSSHSGGEACVKSATPQEGAQAAVCSKGGSMSAQASGYTVVLLKEPQLV